MRGDTSLSGLARWMLPDERAGAGVVARRVWRSTARSAHLFPRDRAAPGSANVTCMRRQQAGERIIVVTSGADEASRVILESGFRLFWEVKHGMFYNFTQLVMVEGLYQTIRGIAASQRVIFGREQFLKQVYTIIVDVDGLLALVKAGKPLNIVVAGAPQLNGRGGPPNGKLYPG